MSGVSRLAGGPARGLGACPGWRGPARGLGRVSRQPGRFGPGLAIEVFVGRARVDTRSNRD